MAADSEDTNIQSPQPTITLPTPHCFRMQELSAASAARAQVSEILTLIRQNNPLSPAKLEFQSTPVYTHLSCGLAYTIGSALGYIPPTTTECLAAFQVANGVGLTAGARAWTKHAHRSHSSSESKKPEPGWWGFAQGPVKVLNEGAYTLFYKVLDNASWRNLHMLPHSILAYEVRVPEGYGMRWSQNLSPPMKEGNSDYPDANEGGPRQEGDSAGIGEHPWIFRGFLEPMIENGHEVGWRHPIVDAHGSVVSSEIGGCSVHSP